MKRGTMTFGKLLGAVAAACLATAAHASPGDGVRLGGSDARIHPFFDFETRYDSNVTYSGTDPVGDVILHFLPGLELKAPGEAAAVEFSGALDWAQYLGLDQASTRDLSRMYAYAKIAAAFNRSGQVAPRVDNDFNRQVSTASLAALATPVVSNQNKLALSVPWRPGGGAIVLAANGEWIVESFEKYQVDIPNLSNLGYDQYRAGAEVQWRFLPRTSGVFNASYYQRVANASGQPQNASGVDVWAGLTGLLTPRVAATAKLGYGSASAQAFTISSGTNAGSFPSTSYGTVLADLAVEWLPMDALSFRVGYLRNVGLDPALSIMVQNSVNGLAELKFAERYAFRVGARWDSFGFQVQPANGGETSFLRVDPTVEGKFGRWLTGSFGYVYSYRSASWPDSLKDNSGNPLTQPPYSKNELFLRVGATY